MDTKNQVYWQTLKSHTETPIANNASCDVVVIGGGMAGLSAAQTLVKAGKQVIILEQDFCGSGASGKSSGFITPDSELELSTLIENFGLDKAKKLWEFVASGLSHIRSTIELHNINCDYQTQDSLFVANSEKRFKNRVIPEHEARLRLGYESTLYTREQIGEVIGSRYYHGGVRYTDTFGMNSYLYCQALKDILIQKGVTIYEKSPVTKIETTHVQSNEYKVSAQQIVVCADRFLPKLGILKADVYQAQTFLGLTSPLSDATIKAIFPKNKMMVWDTDLIYQYYRIVQDNRLLIGAASMFYTYLPFEVSHPRNVERTMNRYLSERFPDLNIDLQYFWPGMIGVSKDFVPLAGQDKTSPNLYYVGAATGLPWAAALGQYIADKIITGRDDFDIEFSPNRKYPLSSKIQALIRKPITFALSHGIVKYFS